MLSDENLARACEPLGYGMSAKDEAHANPIFSFADETLISKREIMQEYKRTRDALRALIPHSRATLGEEFLSGRAFWMEPGGNCMLCERKSSWDAIRANEESHESDCSVALARACLPEFQEKGD